MANFDLTNLAVKMICPNNVVKTDDTDLPSVLVYIPKFKNSDGKKRNRERILYNPDRIGKSVLPYH